MVGWAQHKALPTSLPGSPATNDTGPRFGEKGRRSTARVGT